MGRGLTSRQGDASLLLASCALVNSKGGEGRLQVGGEDWEGGSLHMGAELQASKGEGSSEGGAITHKPGIKESTE